MNLLKRRGDQCRFHRRKVSDSARFLPFFLFAPVGRAARQPGPWVAQAAELLIWGLQLTAATLAVGVIALVLLKLLSPEQIDFNRTALTGGIVVIGMIISFTRKLWPLSPFKIVWLATHKVRLTVGTGKNA